MLPKLVLLCFLSCASGRIKLDKLLSSMQHEESHVSLRESDLTISTKNSVLLEHVKEFLAEISESLDSQEISGKVRFEDPKFFCSGDVTKKYRSCKEKCKMLSVFKRLLCNTKNFGRYLQACFSGTMECYSDTSVTVSSGSSDCGCDYSTFSSSHTMNKYRGPDQSCGAYKKTGVTEDDIKTILKTHNNLRDGVAKGLETQGSPGPQPSAKNMFELKWNCELAEVSQRWAEQCTLGHDQGDDRKICSQDYNVGQNAYQAWGFDAASVWEGAINSWYDEVKDMSKNLVNSFGSSPPLAPVIGHYTQVVWAETYEVGCGAIHFPDSIGGTNYPEAKVYVCNYGPGGNWIGSKIYESGPAASNCPNGVSADFPGLCAQQS